MRQILALPQVPALGEHTSLRYDAHLSLPQASANLEDQSTEAQWLGPSRHFHLKYPVCFAYTANSMPCVVYLRQSGLSTVPIRSGKSPSNHKRSQALITTPTPDGTAVLPKEVLDLLWISRPPRINTHRAISRTSCGGVRLDIRHWPRAKSA